ncbi:MAG: efflux RND transporter periplasmic adaptor subunit [Bacteroidota bacterium]|nr:efflux RND transporter periplasmic adaptor subunit [Bacteroidota bacterium]
MRKKKIVIPVILVVVTAAFSFWYFSSSSSSEVTYRFEKVQRGSIQVTVTATGTLSADTTVEVGTQVSGIVSKIYVDFNSKVKQGEVIAQIDPTVLQANVHDAEAALQRARAQANNSKRIYERTKVLFDKGLASQQEYDAALSAQESDQAQVKSAQVGLERAQINLKYSTIRAPIDGVVISRAVNAGQTVAASLATPTLFTIANDLTKMQVQADVDEADIGNVEVGQEVTFTVDAYPEQVFRGTVKQIRLLPQTVQNVVNYTVMIDVPNKDMKLLPGMTATVTILVSKKENVLKVPTIALHYQPMPNQIEQRKDSAGNVQDSVRAARRRMFMQRMQGGGGTGGMGGGGSLSEGSGREGMQRMMEVRHVGRLWLLGKDKKLQPLFVRTGLSDGTYTEITQGTVQEGEEIVVGQLSSGAAQASNGRGGPNMRFRF